MFDQEQIQKEGSLFYSHDQQKQQQQPLQQSQVYDQSYVNGLFDQEMENRQRIVIQQVPQKPKLSLRETCSQIITIEFYQEYFDVTTEIILQRIASSFNPFSKNFFKIQGGKPDFYGPFWITTTLIFFMAFSSNLHLYLQNKGRFNYQFNVIPYAAILVYILPHLFNHLIQLYGKTLVFPMIIKIILITNENINKISYSQVIQEYQFKLKSAFAFMDTLAQYKFLSSYSLQFQINKYNGCFFCMEQSPQQCFQYLTLKRNLYYQNYLQRLFELQQTNQSKFFIILVIASMQVSLLLVLKFYFFQQLTEEYLVSDQDPNQINKFMKHLHS